MTRDSAAVRPKAVDATAHGRSTTRAKPGTANGASPSPARKGSSARAEAVAAPLYMFAIVGAPLTRDVPGIELVRAAGAWVAVARTPVPAPTFEAAIEHDRVVCAIAKACDAVLPLRFGTSAKNARAVATKLAPFRRAIREGLARVEGAVQLTMRVSGRQMSEEARARQALLRATGHHATSVDPGRAVAADGAKALRRVSRPLAVSRAGTAADVGGPGAKFLSRKLAATSVPEVAPLRDALEAYVRDTRIERRPVGDSFASLFFLVPRAKLAGWRRVVREVEIPHVVWHVTGPWPPYAFAELA